MGESAQVHPFLLTNALKGVAESKGVNFISGTATSIQYMASGAVEAVAYQQDGAESIISATDVVVAAGPWTPSLVPEIRLLAPTGHSLVVLPRGDLSNYVIFPPDDLPADQAFPEIHPRPADTITKSESVYLSGGDYYDSPLPAGTESVELNQSRCEDIWDQASRVSREIRDGRILVRQACYKAQIRKHFDYEAVGPIVGPMEGVKGLWISTGFDEWGVQNGPGAGLIMSEMLMDGQAKSAQVDSLHPRHFATPMK